MMTSTRLMVCCAALTPLLGYNVDAIASTVFLAGDYVQFSVNDIGTLGNGSRVPGIQYDPSGTRNFGTQDYLTPGTPFEGFAVVSNQTGRLVNENSGGVAAIPTVSGPTNTSTAATQTAVWTGSVSGAYTISNTYALANDGQRIDITTVITAATNLTGVKFLRVLDPDQDSFTYGSPSTDNGRGSATLSPQDWVHSVGPISGLPIGLYSTSAITHNTGVSGDWSENPDDYLAGIDDGNGDNVIGLAFDIGDLSAGQIVTLLYYYVMGGSLDDLDLPASTIDLSHGDIAPNIFSVDSPAYAQESLTFDGGTLH